MELRLPLVVVVAIVVAGAVLAAETHVCIWLKMTQVDAMHATYAMCHMPCMTHMGYLDHRASGPSVRCKREGDERHHLHRTSAAIEDPSTKLNVQYGTSLEAR
jgi:hypothetical protein